MQRTLKRALRFAGVGLHSGRPAALELRPAPAGSGVVFFAGDPSSSAGVAATITNVDAAASRLCTRLGSSSSGARVSTVEHLLAALAASRVSNAHVVVSAADRSGSADLSVEVPILDGSSAEFVRGILAAGVEEQPGEPAGYIKVLRPVQALRRDKAAWLLPRPEAPAGAADAGAKPVLDLSVLVNFEARGLGQRASRFTLGADPEANAAAFLRDVAPARTFTFEDEVAQSRARGLALGGSLDNAVVFAEAAAGERARPLNAGGLRFPDEWARHKMLDCVGDLALAGRPLHAFFLATSPGHALTHELLRELLGDERNFQVCE